jgi:hypothetical protein
VNNSPQQRVDFINVERRFTDKSLMGFRKGQSAWKSLLGNTLLGLVSAIALAIPSAYSSEAVAPREDDPIWKTFVVGDVNELPESPIKKFLINAHRNNPYAKTIAEKTRKLGPFAPEADHVFWIPTIDVPMEKENWRFLSSLDDVPVAMRRLTYYKLGGKTYVRMFLHPYSIQEPSFIRMAEKFGGFKYEFQGSTTASVRSLIAWKAETPKPVGMPGRLEFPKDPEAFLWPKVSVTRADIDGSRLNPAKKMVRAYAVTRLMDEIPDSTKKEIGFQFAGEWVVGVPAGTDAGYVTREVLPAYTNQLGQTVEPGFSVLSPERLSEMTNGIRQPEIWIQEKLIRPVFKTIAYLMMAEGMVGEYHNQNFNYLVGKDGIPTGEILLHDADAFRTSILLRTLLGKDTGAIRKIDAPFYFMKDGVFLQTEGSASEYGLNSLIHSYFSDPSRSDSVAGFIKTWCKGVKKYAAWCNDRELTKMFNSTFGEELAPYVGHDIPNLELSEKIRPGKVGLLALFKERLEKVSAESELFRGEVRPEIQAALFEEYQRLLKAGRGKSLNANITLENSNFILEIEDGNAVIHVVAKNPAKGKLFKGVALPALYDDVKAVEFAKKIKALSGIVIPLGAEDGLRNGVLAKPWITGVGGGSNIPASVHDYLAHRKPGLAPGRTNIFHDCLALLKSVFRVPAVR